MFAAILKNHTLMKYTLTIILSLLFFCSHGQELAYSPAAFQSKRLPFEDSTGTPMRHMHCGATRTGKVLMITGGSITAASAIIWAASAPGSVGASNTGMVIFGIFGGTGIVIASYGAIAFVAGKIYEHQNPERFTIYSQNDRVGFAYNFR